MDRLDSFTARDFRCVDRLVLRVARKKQTARLDHGAGAGGFIRAGVEIIFPARRRWRSRSCALVGLDEFSLGRSRQMARTASGCQRVCRQSHAVLVALCHRTWNADRHLRHRIYGGRCWQGLRALLQRREHFYSGHVHIGHGRQLAFAVFRLGRRGFGQLLIGWLLLQKTIRRGRGQEGVHCQSRRRPWPGRWYLVDLGQLRNN